MSLPAFGSLFIYLLTGQLKKLQTDFEEIFGRGGKWIQDLSKMGEVAPETLQTTNCN